MNLDFSPSKTSPVGKNLRENISYTSDKNGKNISRRNFLKYLGIGGLTIGTGLGLEKLIEIGQKKKLDEKIIEEEKRRTFNVFLDDRKPAVISQINEDIKPSFEKRNFTYVQVCAVENINSASEEYKKYHDMGLEVDIVPLHKENKILNRVMINCYDSPKFLSWFLGESRLMRGEYFTLQRETLFPVYSKEQKIELITRESKKRGLDEKLLLSIWPAESTEGKDIFGFKFDYDKIRKRHFVRLDEYGKVDEITAIGDFMINPTYHKGEIRDLIYFENNLNAALDYLVVLEKRYKGNINQMLSEWNGGTNKMKWKTPETKNFVKKVLGLLNNYSDSDKISSI